MKAILGVLLCYVFFASQCFAIKGGPDYGGSTSLIGQYAGVLTADPGSDNGASANSLGIFTLGVPSVGFANGQLIIFTTGVYFFGSIQGIAQPNRRISALANANETVTRTIIVNGVPVSVTDTVSVLDGQISATVGTQNGSFGSAGALSGTAVFNRHDTDGTNTTPPLSFNVVGFQQTAAPPA